MNHYPRSSEREYWNRSIGGDVRVGVPVDGMAPKMTPTSAAPTMSQVAIRKLVADSVSAALEAQASTNG
ncbi:hypothetical protein Tco_0267325 [Tanacetum coccineum]